MTPTRGLVWRGGLAARALAAGDLAVAIPLDLSVIADRGESWALVAKIRCSCAPGGGGCERAPAAQAAQELGVFARFSPRAAAVHGVALVGFFVVAQRLFRSDTAMSPWWGVPWLLFVALLAISLPATLFGVQGPGQRRRRLLTAGVLAGVLAWIVALESEPLRELIATPTLVFAGWILHWVSLDVFIDRGESVLAFENFVVQMAPMCGSSEGIGISLVLLGAYLVTKRKELRMPRALWLLPLAAAATWLANALRIALIMLIGARVSENLALGAFHSKAGWPLFCLVTIVAAWWAHRKPLFRRDTPDRESWENPSAPLLVPLLAVLAASLLEGAFQLDWN